MNICKKKTLQICHLLTSHPPWRPPGAHRWCCHGRPPRQAAGEEDRWARLGRRPGRCACGGAGRGKPSGRATQSAEHHGGRATVASSTHATASPAESSTQIGCSHRPALALVRGHPNPTRRRRAAAIQSGGQPTGQASGRHARQHWAASTASSPAPSHAESRGGGPVGLPR